MELWGSDDCVKKSEINAKNRRGGHETAAGTHTVGSISMGEYHKRHVSTYFTNYTSKILTFSTLVSKHITQQI